MNQSPLTTNDSQADDALDRLLREYFQTQMPRQFPPLPLGVAEPAARMQPTSPMSRSRWVLAVCVALVLLGFGWLLKTQSSNVSSNLPGINLNDTANKTNPMPPKLSK